MSGFVYRGSAGFAGLDRRVAAADGAIFDMVNFSSRDLPVLSSRGKRTYVRQGDEKLSTAIWAGRLFYIAGGAFFDDGEPKLTLSDDGPKKLCKFQNKILIMPDGILYDIEEKTYEQIKETVTCNVCFQRYTLSQDNHETEHVDIVLPYAKYGGPSHTWKAGQYVVLDIAPYGVNSTYSPIKGVYKIIRQNYVFDRLDRDYWFKSYEIEGLDYNSIEWSGTVSYGIPDMDVVFEHGNRLWASHGGEIFCSALGQADVWYDYDVLSTSAWRVALSSGDEAQGGCVVSGMPCFFAEHAIYKVYGDSPAEFSYARTSALGIKRGEGDSLCAVGERCFYLSKRGICAYSGGSPTVVSEMLGSERFSHARGGTDGVCYYVHMQDAQGNAFLYVYDADKGVWVKEDDLPVIAMYSHDGEAACVTAGGDTVLLSGTDGEGETEDSVSWMLETADFVQGTTVRKVANRLLLRYALDDGALGEVYISYDGGEEIALGVLACGGKRVDAYPMPPIPHDHFKVILRGLGDVRIYALEADVKAMEERK